MREKYFSTFVTCPSTLENEIKKWLEENNLREVDRSAPAFIADSEMRYSYTAIIVGVTVTAEKNN